MRLALALILSPVLLTACASHDHGPEALPPPESIVQGRPVDIVASTTVLGDIVGQILRCAGDGEVEVLMPPGADAHDFSPSSAQVAAMVQADLVVTNGLGLESGLESSVESAIADGARVYAVAPWLDPIPFDGEDEHADDHGEDEHADDHDHGELDPHVWFDMNRMATAATLIAQEIDVITGGEGRYAACGDEVSAEILAAEAEVQSILETVPADRRVLVTDHDALGYFQNRYGYRIAGSVIPVGTTLADPSSADLANLAAVMREQGVDVIFTSVAEPTKLADAVAAEVGRPVTVVPIYVESVGAPGSGADTYIGMMTANAQTIADNLAD